MTSLLRRAGAPLAAVAMVLVVSACGGDDSADSDSTASASSSEPAAPTDDASTGGTDTSAPETTAATSTPTTPATDSTGSGGSGGTGAAPDTVDGAIARYEDLLHALGTKDVATMCEIAGPAAQQAEDDGFGPCETTMAMMADMPSPEQSEALRTATVDPSLVVTDSSGTVNIPAAAVVSSATFTDSDLGISTLAYQDGNWFVID
ncbi:MAG TPA: hypothetical protein VIP77_14635 [Jiangellaceae bacterium]